MATGNVNLTEGSGKYAATYTISEDALTKFLQRITLNSSAGVEQDALGVTTGAKVITDANGTLQQYLRGLIYLLITGGSALVTAGKATVIDVTPTLDTAIYAAGDVLFAETTITNAVRVAGLGTTLLGVTIADKDDEGAALTLYFFDADPNFGTINLAPSIADADTAKCLGIVDIATTDYDDVGGAKIAHVRGFSIPMKPASGTDLFVAATCAGTPTYTSASDLVLRLHFLQD